MKEFPFAPVRSFEVFIVSGDSVNCARTIQSIVNTHPLSPRWQALVLADWPIEEFPQELRRYVDHRPQQKPFQITREYNFALREIWGRGHDAIMVEDDVVVDTPEAFRMVSQFVSVFGGRCLFSPAVRGYKYDNLCLEPQENVELVREPFHYPLICPYFPIELELLVGYYDERFTSYGCDDNDYSMRLYRAGIPMMVASKAIVRHLYDDSVFKARGRDQFASREKFKAKWGQYPGDPRLR